MRDYLYEVSAMFARHYVRLFGKTVVKWQTYNCASTAATFGTSQLCPRKTNAPQVFKKCDFRIRRI